MIIKNSNIRRSIFESRYVIFAVIFAIVLVLYLIQMLNNNIKQENAMQNNQIQNTIVDREDTTSKPVITGNEVKKDTQQANTKIIEQFITYCNNKEIEQAYGLLTDECKEELFFGNMEYFKQNYVDKIFVTKKMASIQSWISGYINTYRVTIQDDILSSGKLDSSNNIIEDYYTIMEQQDGTYKLNINNYIRREKVEKQRQINGITITIVCKDIYKEYESYDITIENMTSKTILLDSKETVDSIYLLGSNDNHYDAFSYEIDKTQTIIKPEENKKLTIRFNKIYSNKIIMRQMIFSDVIADYEEYEKTQNKKEYTDRLRFNIEL